MLSKKIICILIFTILFAGCNLFGSSVDVELVEIKMGKTFNDSTGVIGDLTDTFYPTDEEIVLWLSWNRVQGENNGVIEWHSPDGKLYQEDDFKFTAAKETWATWHRLPIARTDAARTLGDWIVYVSLKGKYMGKKKFTITSTGSGPATISRKGNFK
ncbi:MAG: hypothetical protein PHX78_03570 [bacterium]|nr:hypothetical protein [bacterium]